MTAPTLPMRCTVIDEHPAHEWRSLLDNTYRCAPPVEQPQPVGPLSRSTRGKVVHRRDCGWKGKTTTPWDWADDKTRPQIAAVIILHGYRACGKCKPLGGAS